MAVNEFVNGLKAYIGIITRQQLLTLRGQALSGDIEGAKKGLERILRRANGKTEERNR